MKLSKWQALGNAYLLVERAELPEPLTPDLVRELCEGRSDGILEVVSTNGAHADVKVWNPDGSTAEMSGNGARIAAAWLARKSGTHRVTLHIGDRNVSATVDGNDVVLDAGHVEVGEAESIDVDGEQIEFTPVSVGNPHAVVRREPERRELLRLGPLLERHPRFPQRTNVQLVRIDGRHDITVGVWERGAGETLSSGSSSVAAAAAAIANGWCESPVHVHLPGGDLLVELDENGQARLTGPAVELA
jgi:diaminopimelate epimerase